MVQAVGVVALALMLAGCVGGSEGDGVNPTLAPVQQGDLWGVGMAEDADVPLYVAQGGGEEITDDRGAYTLLPRPADDDLAQPCNTVRSQTYMTESAPDGTSYESVGFTTAVVADATCMAERLVLDLTYDSTILDREVTADEYAAWAEEISGTYDFDAGIAEAVTRPDSLLLLSDPTAPLAKRLPEMVRDGAPRAYASGDAPTGNVVTSRETSLLDNEGQMLLVVLLRTKANYRIGDAAAVEHTAAVEGTSEDEVREKYPDWSDGDGVNFLPVSGTYRVVFELADGGSLRIRAIENTFDVGADGYDHLS